MSYPDGQRKILVIEDEPVFRATLLAFLRQQNHLVYVAENGLDGLAAVAVYHPDLVLCRLDGRRALLAGHDGGRGAGPARPGEDHVQ